MTLLDQLVSVAEVFRAARNLSASRTSTIVFGDGKILRRIGEGRDLTTRRLEEAMQWFSDNWPDAEWPASVKRPIPRKATSQPHGSAPAEASAA